MRNEYYLSSQSCVTINFALYCYQDNQHLTELVVLPPEQDKSSDIEQQPPFGDRENKQYSALK